MNDVDKLIELKQELIRYNNHLVDDYYNPYDKENAIKLISRTIDYIDREIYLKTNWLMKEEQ